MPDHSFQEEHLMKASVGCRAAARIGVGALLVCLCVSRAEPQDPSLKPTYGTVDLKAGFEPDPYKKNLEAGGSIETKEGGVTAWVEKAPDFRLNYTAGNFPLTFYVTSKADTTLLINLPDGKWIANDDGPGTGLNPLIKLAKPKSGQYDIWVGMLEKGKTPPATLHITELK
jgi:hypothetical protein